jgi:hypothetical protein
MKFTNKADTPLAIFLADKAAAQQAQWTLEFEEQEKKRIAAEAAAVELAKQSAESNARRESMDLRSSQMYRTPRTPILCEVCGTLVEPDAEGSLKSIAKHNLEGGTICFRNPRLCRAYGILSAETYDDLTDEQKRGYIVEGASLGGAVYKETAEPITTAAARANILDGGQRYER